MQACAHTNTCKFFHWPARTSAPLAAIFHRTLILPPSPPPPHPPTPLELPSKAPLTFARAASAFSEPVTGRRTGRAALTVGLGRGASTRLGGSAFLGAAFLGASAFASVFFAAGAAGLGPAAAAGTLTGGGASSAAFFSAAWGQTRGGGRNGAG